MSATAVSPNAFTFDGRDLSGDPIWMCDECGERVDEDSFGEHLNAEHASSTPVVPA